MVLSHWKRAESIAQSAVDCNPDIRQHMNDEADNNHVP